VLRGAGARGSDRCSAADPFTLPKADLKAVEISYEMAGDLKGTASTAMDGGMTRSTATGKFPRIP